MQRTVVQYNVCSTQIRPKCYDHSIHKWSSHRCHKSCRPSLKTFNAITKYATKNVEATVRSDLIALCIYSLRELSLFRTLVNRLAHARLRPHMQLYLYLYWVCMRYRLTSPNAIINQISIHAVGIHILLHEDSVVHAISLTEFFPGNNLNT